MRAKIAGMIAVGSIAALTTSFSPENDATHTIISPRPLTEAEAECLIGGETGCLDQGMYTWVECMINGGVDITSGESMYSNASTVGSCFVMGLADAAWCGISSLWDWIF